MAGVLVVLSVTLIIIVCYCVVQRMNKTAGVNICSDLHLDLEDHDPVRAEENCLSIPDHDCEVITSNNIAYKGVIR